MQCQLFIENNELDISQEVSSLLNFELDNISDFGARKTTWSKTIVLPGTARNNKLFGHIFQIGQANQYNAALPNANYNFNAAKSADCLLFQNQLQSFRGVLRLLQINYDKGRVEYEVGLFGEIALLVTSLQSHFLDELDFSAYDTTWTSTNVIASWDNTPGSGVFFPLIDYGQCSVDKKNWDIRAFRPALYVKEYIDKIFRQHSFTYSCDLFNTERFKRLVIPQNKKELLTIDDLLLDVSRTNTATYSSNQNIAFNSLNITGGFTVAGSSSTFTFNGATPITGAFTVKVKGEYYSQTDTIYLELRKNGLVILMRALPATFNNVYTNYEVNFNLSGHLLNTSDVITVAIVGGGTFSVEVQTGTRMTFVSDQPQVTPVSLNGTIKMNSNIPRNVRQLDFLVGIIKLFNLYVWEDKFNPRLIYFKPYVDFYSTDPTDAVDWTYKLDRDAKMTVKPMSELTAKTYSFKYKQDDDYWNRLYRERYRDGYGDHVYDSNYEFAEQTQSLEIIFSATPLLGYENEDKVIPTIYKASGVDASGRGTEESIDHNIRIMQTMKVTDVASYKIYSNPNGTNTPTVLTSVTNYGYAGHFDDPDVPTTDLNFGITKELFFVVSGGDPSRTQFNVYWSPYLAEITDKDSKQFTGRFYLQPKDITTLDFSKKVMIDGVLYRLQSISDYNASVVSDCEVSLLKINYLLY